MDKSGARCMRVKHSTSTARHVSIVSYKHGQEPIRLYKLSQVFKNCYNMVLVLQYSPSFRPHGDKAADHQNQL